MRPWPLLVLACVVGCKAAPDGPTAPLVSPSAPDQPGPDAGSTTEAPTAKGPGDETNDGDAEQRFCEKLTQLMVASRGSDPDPADRQELVDTCVTNARAKRAQAPATFDREVECISGASDLEAFFDCALDDPEPAMAKTGGDERFLPVCEKLAKLARDDADFPEEAKRELQDTARCAADARTEHNAAPRAFEQIERCILAATEMRDAAGCTTAHVEPR